MQQAMKPVIATFIILCYSTAVSDAWSNRPLEGNRRKLLQKSILAGVGIGANTLIPSYAQPASAASLLEEYGTDPTKIQQTTVATTAVVPTKKGDSGIDPTLRASYYYPTAKKRYLPRILKVSQGISDAHTSILNDKWESAQDFYQNADSAILPLKLYASSLDGQGLGMTNTYAIEMKKNVVDYEKHVELLGSAILSREKQQALDAIQAIGIAVTQYRQTGHLTDNDGNIPSVDEMRRMAMRRPTIAVAAAMTK